MRYAISTVAFLALISTCGFAEGAASFDQEKFSLLSQPQRLDFVLAGLEARERRLNNFSYRAVEDQTNVDLATGARTPGCLVTLELKRAGEAYLFHVSSSEFRNRQKTRDDIYVNWDGKKSHQIIMPHKEVPFPTGSVTAYEGSHLYHWRYNGMLGFRVESDGKTLSRWLRAEVSAPTSQTTIDSFEEGARKLIRLACISGSLQYSVTLDPADDFLLLRLDRHYQRGFGFNDWHQEVLQSRQIAGLTVPIKTLYSVSTSTANWKTEILTEASEFKIGEVKPADTELIVPAGTQIHDYTTKTPAQ